MAKPRLTPRQRHARYLKNQRLAESAPEVYLPKTYGTNRGISGYELVHGDLTGSIVGHARRLMSEGIVSKERPFKLLDVGCGNGVFLGELASHLDKYKIPHELHGVALTRPDSDFFIDTTTLKVHIGDAHRLPNDWNKQFHFVVSTSAFPYFRDKLRVLREIHRVMHPEGKASLHLKTGQVRGLKFGSLKSNPAFRCVRLVPWGYYQSGKKDDNRIFSFLKGKRLSLPFRLVRHDPETNASYYCERH